MQVTVAYSAILNQAVDGPNDLGLLACTLGSFFLYTVGMACSGEESFGSLPVCSKVQFIFKRSTVHTTL